MASLEHTDVKRQAQGADEAWLRTIIAFERTGALLASSCSLIDESRRSLATIHARRQTRRVDALLGSSRALIDDSRELLEAVHKPGPTPLPNSPLAVPHGEPACLPRSAPFSARVFEVQTRFGWCLMGPQGEMLGQGTAETELKARIDVFDAGMTYIERLKSRSRPTGGTVH